MRAHDPEPGFSDLSRSFPPHHLPRTRRHGVRRFRLSAASRPSGAEGARLERCRRTTRDGRLLREDTLDAAGRPLSITTSEAGAGVARAIDDDWGWLNAPSGARFGASGLAVRTTVACICGFCVDASLEVSTHSAVLSTDLHWTRGPCVRVDGALHVTDDHPLVTPSGHVLAGGWWRAT